MSCFLPKIYESRAAASRHGNSERVGCMKYRFLRFPGFRTKALTASFDDGTVYDRQLVAIFNRYGIKGTFNIPGFCYEYGPEKENVLSKEELRSLYWPNGHEVAIHGYQHQALINSVPIDGIREVLEGRMVLERFYGKIIRGMAYPDRTATNETIESYLKMLNVVYARAAGKESGSFSLPEDWLCWMPTCKHTDGRLMEYADKFLQENPAGRYCAARDPILFFFWGHSFECVDRWNIIEDLCKKVGGRDDIWYATNMELYEYVSAYRSLIFSADNTLVCNPTQIRVSFDEDYKLYTVGPGETLVL